MFLRYKKISHNKLFYGIQFASNFRVERTILVKLAQIKPSGFLKKLFTGLFTLFLPVFIAGQSFKDLAENDFDSLIQGIDPNDFCGFACVIGDITGDVYDDLIFSAPKADGPDNETLQGGEIYLFKGKRNRFRKWIDLAADADTIIHTIRPYDFLGIALEVGDVNGDGLGDLIIGVPYGDGIDDENEDAGEIYILFGRTFFPPEIVLPDAIDVTLYGHIPADAAGRRLCTGDLNHDGIQDLLIGAPLANGPDETREDAGSIYVVYGRPHFPDTLNLATDSDITIYGSDSSDHTGSAMHLGDLDHNGLNDLIIGTSLADGPLNFRPDAGEVIILYDLGGFTGTIDLRHRADTIFYGEFAEDSAGSSLLVSDVQGDGIQDLLIGAPQADEPSENKDNAGALYILYGGERFPQTVDLRTTRDVIFYGRDKRDNFGGGLTAGDFNGDGISDVAIRARLGDAYPDAARENCGSVFICYGRRDYPPELMHDRDAATVFLGAGVNDELGSALSAGRLNDDSMDDLAVTTHRSSMKTGKVYLLYGDRKPYILASPGPGPVNTNPADVRIFGPYTNMQNRSDFAAYPSDSYGARIATGDVNGDSISEIITGVGPGPVSHPPNVRVFLFNGKKLAGFIAYGMNRYGVNVAAGDLDGNGMDEIITGPGPGAAFGPHVRVWQFETETFSFEPAGSFLAYGTRSFGVQVSSGDMDGDGDHEILTAPGPGYVFGPHIRGWNYQINNAAIPINAINFFAYETRHFGCRIGAGNIDSDPFDEILSAPGPGSFFGPHVRGWNYDNDTIESIEEINFFAYPSHLKYGARVATADLDGDGFSEIITGPGPGMHYGTHIRGWNYDGENLNSMPDINFFAFGPEVKYGVTPAAGTFGM